MCKHKGLAVVIVRKDVAYRAWPGILFVCITAPNLHLNSKSLVCLESLLVSTKKMSQLGFPVPAMASRHCGPFSDILPPAR